MYGIVLLTLDPLLLAATRAFQFRIRAPRRIPT